MTAKELLALPDPGITEHGITKTKKPKSAPDINRILAKPEYNVSSSFGAPMGRRNQCDGAAEMLHLQRIRFVDGDYDAGGAYWGGGIGTDPLWCAFSPDDTNNEEPIMIFVRAKTQADAIVAVLDEVKEGGDWSFVIAQISSQST